MITFDKFVLDNGLKVLVHHDNTTPVVAVNILYDIGARDEHPEKTGFAHLFEHLMFGGSIHIPKYDEPLEKAGGENNAFTNNDITNYYLTIPVNNMETAFWLESDRMLSLAFSEKSLEVQRNVVSEEFKQVYLNQPYGDVWLLLRELAYKVHPYQWPTIGKKLEHIQQASMQDVKDFFFRFYRPNNAIMVVAGNINTENVKKLADKWFGAIPKGNVPLRNLPKEPEQKEFRFSQVKRDVPFDAIYRAYHICDRLHKNYYATDLLSDILGNGKSSRLYQALIKEKKLFSDISAYISGDRDEGLLIISGKLLKGVDLKDADNAIDSVLENIISKGITEDELQKVKNRVESTIEFSKVNIMDKAMDIAYMEWLSDGNEINNVSQYYQNVTAQQILDVAKYNLRKTNCSEIHYLSNTN